MVEYLVNTERKNPMQTDAYAAASARLAFLSPRRFPMLNGSIKIRSNKE